MLFQNNVSALLAEIEPEQGRLAGHELYPLLGSVDDLRLFMERHVFAVWDFMCLLKSLQSHLTCVDARWRPVGAPSTRRLINELVLAEESDLIDGVATGHFEYYMSSMQQIGADTDPIERLLELVRHGTPTDRALVLADVPPEAAEFVRATFRFIDTGKPHVIAAAFTFGREDALPAIFTRISERFAGGDPALERLATYLQRHVELDGDDHGPKAIQMICELCGDDAVKWEEATLAAKESLQARIHFWTGIATQLCVPSFHIADALLQDAQLL